MEKIHFSLETKDDNRFIRITRIIFGLICFAIALFWLMYRVMANQSDSAQWITITFLGLFGAYQVYAGFGLAEKFIEISQEKILLKQNSVFPSIELRTSQITRIDLYPFKVLFLTSPDKTVLLRFGISEPEKVEAIKKSIVRFAEENNLTFEIKSE
jgi:hypothetical protein